VGGAHQPESKGHGPLHQVFLHSLYGLQLRFLHDVRCVQTRAEPSVLTAIHGGFDSGLVALEQLSKVLLAAALYSIQQQFCLGRILSKVVHHLPSLRN
jgi:hypothetical protein